MNLDLGRDLGAILFREVKGHLYVVRRSQTGGAILGSCHLRIVGALERQRHVVRGPDATRLGAAIHLHELTLNSHRLLSLNGACILACERRSSGGLAARPRRKPGGVACAIGSAMRGWRHRDRRHP